MLDTVFINTAKVYAEKKERYRQWDVGWETYRQRDTSIERYSQRDMQRNKQRIQTEKCAGRVI